MPTEDRVKLIVSVSCALRQLLALRITAMTYAGATDACNRSKSSLTSNLHEGARENPNY